MSILVGYDDSGSSSSGGDDGETEDGAWRTGESNNVDYFNFSGELSEPSSSSTKNPDVSSNRERKKPPKSFADPVKTNPPKSKLPPPVLKLVKKSVFVSDFDKKEKAKRSVLEQHVRLSEIAEKTQKPRRKPFQNHICKQFQITGQCRYGKKCKFSHKLETVADQSNDGGEGPVVGGGDDTSNFTPLGGAHGGHDSATGWGDTEDDNNQTKKRRSHGGLPRGLAPAKKSQKNLDKMRADERPWTLQ